MPELPRIPGPMNAPMEVCPQCGFLHPRLKPDEICPAAPTKTSDGSRLNLDNFFNMASSILKANVSKKNIKNHEKFVSYLILEFNKIVENYEE